MDTAAGRNWAPAQRPVSGPGGVYPGESPTELKELPE
jgi:hypothetical protein